MPSPSAREGMREGRGYSEKEALLMFIHETKHRETHVRRGPSEVCNSCSYKTSFM